MIMVRNGGSIDGAAFAVSQESNFVLAPHGISHSAGGNRSPGQLRHRHSGWKLTTGFGFPAFLNFGRNYEGSRDGYVYVYSHDNDSAYEPADRLVLARVPKGEIKRQGAYEYFEGLAAR